MNNTDPIKVEIVEPRSHAGGDDVEGCIGRFLVAGLVAAGFISLYSDQGFFESMVGRLVFVPALIAVFLLGFGLAKFLFNSCLGLLALVVIGFALFALYQWIVGGV